MSNISSKNISSFAFLSKQKKVGKGTSSFPIPYMSSYLELTTKNTNSFGSRCHKSTFFFTNGSKVYEIFFLPEIENRGLPPQSAKLKKEQKTKQNKSSHRTCAQGETEFTCFVPKYERFGSIPPL